MNIARNTRDIPINGIFANKSMRAMRPTSIDRMTVVPVNTFRRCGGGEMELHAARVGGDPVEQQVCHRVGRSSRIQWPTTTSAGGRWGYAIAAVTAVTGFALAFRDLS
jgi:hypothetical protein